MKTPILFHLDESMPAAVAAGLSKRDRDCTTSKEARLISASDEEQLAYATNSQRMLITRDDDFLLLASENSNHAGIIYWTEKNHFGQLIKDLDILASEKSSEEMQGVVIYL